MKTEANKNTEICFLYQPILCRSFVAAITSIVVVVVVVCFHIAFWIDA